jgi:predicted nucleic acid-binding protein
MFDTSILIPYFARRRYVRDIGDSTASDRVWLSSLVALELYVGTRDQAEKRALDAFVASFERRQRVLTPTHADHVLAGLLLNRRRRLVGDLEARRHVVDMLIVLSASQVGATIVTANVEHLGVWAAMARRSGRDVQVRAPVE